jgi:DNA polymerase-3 subunit alpha
MTKSNKPMGFVTLEDIQGNIETVLFPRTWEKYLGTLTVGQIVVIDGKVDTSNTPPKILVDAIRTDLKTVSAEDKPHPPLASAPQGKAAPAPKVVQSPKPQPANHMPAKQATDQSATYAAKPAPLSSPRQAGGSENDRNVKDAPPPPDSFPDGWDAEWQPSFEVAQMAARAEPQVEELHVEPPPVMEPAQAESKVEEAPPLEVPREAKANLQPVEVSPLARGTEGESEPPALPSLYVPLAQEEKDADHPPKQITVLLRSTGDKERDKRRIKTIYGTLISFHGRDRFTFHVFENGKGHLIDFPNDTTRICPEMLARLGKLMGEESWRIEEIRFQ